ncbi:MAG TPA: 50S ribosomal protein L9 [Phycisphaerae bacterium]|nr:50S ribosomal protein L9 [Phycisphaerae bacterium]HRW51259.1 50S ribosomal protein L9 [Phycisphaerae bacterium]
MKLLLRKDIDNLGLCGDVVDVSSGYARNYLLPHHLALEPTKANLKAIEEDKKIAAAAREQRRKMLVETCGRLEGVEVTISAACTPEGHLYGSVGPREISSALMNDGHSVHPDQIKMTMNLKEVGTYQVPVVFAEEIRTEIKVWVVREKALGEDEDEATGETEITNDADAVTPDAEGSVTSSSDGGA